MATPFPAIDSAMQRFGFHPIVPHGPLHKRDVVLVRAATLQVKLADDYVYFLTTYGPGSFDGRVMVDLPSGCPIGRAFDVDILYGSGSRDDWDPFELATSTYEGQLPRGILPIATDPGGSLLVTRAGGEVLAWDHEHRELPANGLHAITADLQGADLDIDDLDVGQLILLWEETFPDRVRNPTGHGNLYPLAGSFSDLCAAMKKA